MVRSLDEQCQGWRIQIWESVSAEVTLEQCLERCFRFGHLGEGVEFLVD